MPGAVRPRPNSSSVLFFLGTHKQGVVGAQPIAGALLGEKLKNKTQDLSTKLGVEGFRNILILVESQGPTLYRSTLVLSVDKYSSINIHKPKNCNFI